MEITCSKHYSSPHLRWPSHETRLDQRRLSITAQDAALRRLPLGGRAGVVNESARQKESSRHKERKKRHTHTQTDRQTHTQTDTHTQTVPASGSPCWRSHTANTHTDKLDAKQ